MATIRLEGFRELERELEKLGTVSARKASARRALKKAAAPMAEIARALAPDDPRTGGFDLKRSIIVGTKLSRSEKKQHRKMFRNDKAAVEMFVGAGPLPQAIFAEFGTSPFINKGMFAGSLNPGMRPQPFMRPAFDQDHRALLDRLKAELWADIEKAVTRAQRRAARGG